MGPRRNLQSGGRAACHVTVAVYPCADRTPSCSTFVFVGKSSRSALQPVIILVLSPFCALLSSNWHEEIVVVVVAVAVVVVVVVPVVVVVAAVVAVVVVVVAAVVVVAVVAVVVKGFSIVSIHYTGWEPRAL